MSVQETDTTRRRGPAWWHGLRPMTRRIVRYATAFVGSGLLAVAVGVPTASFAGSLGPHEAQYSVRLNDEVRVDMGPLGALIVDSPLPLRLGVYVRVQEIPVELSGPGASPEEANPVAGLTADLASYSQFFANPQAAIDQAARGLVLDAAGRTVLAWSLLLTVVALGRLAAHGVLRDAARSAWRQTGVPAVACTLAVVLVALPLVEATRSSGDVGRTSAILGGTPLADARITGRLATLVDYYGGYVVDAVNENAEFYESARANLADALAADTQAAGPTEEPTSTGGPTPTGGHTEAEDAAEPAGTASPEATDAPAVADETTDEAETTEPTDPADLVTMLMISDLHCNVGMADVIGEAVRGTGADLVLNAGDTVMGGTSVESYCVDAFAQGIGTDVPVVAADGNHDSEDTAQQERDAGWTVLAGEPVEVAGVRILGDTDPTLTSLGAPTHPVRDESISQFGMRLRDTACELADADDPVDILLVHSPYAGRQAVEAGCVPLSLSGHLHRQVGPRQLGWGVQYTSASTAGAGSGTPTIGPLNNPAVMTVIRWDPQTRLPRDYRLITIGTDTSAELSEWFAIPDQPEEFVTDEPAEDAPAGDATDAPTTDPTDAPTTDPTDGPADGPTDEE